MLPLVPASASACETVVGRGSTHVLSPRRNREIEAVPLPILAAASNPPVPRRGTAPTTMPESRVAMVPSPSCPRAPTAVPEFVPPREIGAKPDGLQRLVPRGRRVGPQPIPTSSDTRTFRPASRVPAVSHQRSPLDAPVGAVALIVMPPPAPAARAAIAWATLCGDHVRYPRSGPGFGFRLRDNRVIVSAPTFCFRADSRCCPSHQPRVVPQQSSCCCQGQ